MEDSINKDKPNDWPQNEREARLSNVLRAVEEFIKRPTYANKEVMISLITISDLNEYSVRGLIRVTDYEIDILNRLYYLAILMCFSSLKIFVYNEIAYTIQNINIISKMPNSKINVEDYFKKYNYIDSTLRIFMLAIFYYDYYKENSLANEIINVVKDIIKNEEGKNLKDISVCYNILLLDLSYHTTIKSLFLPEFTYEEMKKLLELEFELIKKTKQNILKRPLKGVVKITISNWILRARNNYSCDYFYKCMNDNNAISSVINHEIWMRDIRSLNDEREGQVLQDLFISTDWINFDWAKNIKPTLTHKYYVNCFSRNKPNEKMMQEYGKNLYGFKTDRIADEISPVIINNRYKIPELGYVPQFGQVVCFDVLYSQTEVIKEINNLLSIIDLIFITDAEKSEFAQEILEYWIYSVKDSKWKEEKERRYQIFLFPNLDYDELKEGDGFLKIKTYLFSFPDFINHDNVNFTKIKANIFDKYYAIAIKEFVQCEDCLNLDYDFMINGYDEKTYSCKICGSSKHKRINPIIFKKSCT